MAIALNEDQRAGLKLLRDLSDEQRSTLLDVCRHEPPRLDLGIIAASVAERVGANRDALEQAFSTIASIHGYARKEEIALAQAVAEVLSTFAENEKESLEGLTPLQDFILGMLDSKSGFSLSARAISISWEHSELFQEVRILTDLRPIFDEPAGDVAGSVVGQALTHTLRLTYISREREMMESRFILMTSKDLEDLARCITRALSKEKALKEDHSLVVVS